MKRLRVAVWDPSSSIRSLLRRLLSHMEGIEVVELDGGGSLRAGSLGPLDVAVIGFGAEGVDTTSLAGGGDGGPRLVLLTPPGFLHRRPPSGDRLGKGVAVLPKPSTEAGWKGLGTQLEELIRDLAAASPGGATGEIHVPRPAVPPAPAGRRAFRFAVVGGSSGGPAALHTMLGAMGRGSAMGLAVVQHIAPGFEVELTRWLARDLEMDVAVAGEGEQLLPGTVRIAPAGAHLRLEDGGRLLVDRRTPPRNGHRPSVDELFLSVEARFLPVTVAILLDGMGRDGVEGLGRVRSGGGTTIVQDPETCVVGGMPLAALREEVALHVLSPASIGRFLVENSGRGSRP